MKPYQQVIIQECGEPLLPIPDDLFAFVLPHPYQALNAPYGNKSPFYLRQSVLEGLITAQQCLSCVQPGWRIQVFDAYRPVAVQQFMVNYSFAELAHAQGLSVATLSNQQQQELLASVYQFWAQPSLNPDMPPPHSTGAAVDITLVDETGHPIDMGSPIDEISPRSYPEHYAQHSDSLAQQYHQHRQLLATIMTQAGFLRHQNEWWHFSMGDQMWAWLKDPLHNPRTLVARYGRYDLCN
jgi:zinc D-Ala-D-Ala dipeptidase